MQSAGKWDFMIEALPLINTALLLLERYMPRGRGTRKPDEISVTEYPSWFKDFAEGQNTESGVMQWLRDYNSDDFKELILSVLADGGAMFISQTRDGGAVGFTVMFGDMKKRLYAANPDELDIIIQKVTSSD